MASVVNGRRFVIAAIVSCAVASWCIGQVTFDGNIDSGVGEEWGAAKATALQDNYTGYGDQRLVPGGFPGSELDELFVTTDGTYLYVGVTGNLEQNGNSIILLFDTKAGGQNVLASEIAPRLDELPCAENGPPAAVQGLGQALVRDDGGTPDDTTDDVTSRDPGSTGTTLDVGFEPDYAIAIDTLGGSTYVTQYDLFATSLGTWDDPSTGFGGCVLNPDSPASQEALDYYATRVYRGAGAVNSGSGVLGGGDNPNASQFAFNNTGKLGVTGESPTPPPAAGSGLPGDPRSQTTGLEARIHLADLGYTTPVAGPLEIKVSALLTGSDGFISNQTLPPIGGGTDLSSLGARPDFTGVAGDQFATVSRSLAAFTGSIDGTDIVNDFGVPNVVASQDTVTGFGDRDCLTATGGSELDELMMRTDGNYLYVAVTGNLETNSNAQVLLLDVQPGGQNVLKTEIAPVVAELPCSGNGPPVAVQGLGQLLQTNDGGTPEDPTDDETSRDPSSGGSVMDAGFEPDYAIAVDTTGGNLYVNQYSMYDTVQGQWDDPNTGQPDCAAPNEALDYFTTRIFRGQIPLNSSSAGPASLADGTNPNGSEFAYNNGAYAGVTGTDVAAVGSGLPGDPRTQTRGFEAKISLLDLGFAPAQLPVATLDVKAAVLLTASDGFVSNQTLPGINNGTDNTFQLGLQPSFATVAGDQFVTASLTAGAFSPTIDGRDLPNKYGVSNILASQDTVTSFGDATLVTVDNCDQEYSAGSEIDQLLVQDTDTPVSALEIAVTGNLETNGNRLVIFLDTIAEAGEATLAGNPKIGGMDGIVLPLDADYALVVNTWGGTAYVDVVNLIANSESYMGNTPVNTGDGTLSGGAASADWRFVINNNNILGVSGDSGADPQDAGAATAISGFEMSIPLLEIGSPASGSSVCVFAIITNGGSDWLSNQVLPAGLGGGFANFDNTLPDFATLGYSCASIVLGTVSDCNNPRFDINGDTFVDMVDFAEFQRCWTGPLPAGNILEGCECFDWNFAESDERINIEDFAVFQNCAKAAGVPADPTCDDAP